MLAADHGLRRGGSAAQGRGAHVRPSRRLDAYHPASSRWMGQAGRAAARKAAASPHPKATNF